MGSVKEHNQKNRRKHRAKDVISRLAWLHETVAFDKGQKIVVDGDHLLEKKHMGNIVIEDYVSIGAHSVIHYSSHKSTIIGEDTKIGALCNIGHNVIIGKHNIITSGTNIGGSVVIGNGCFFGLNSVVRPHVVIEDGIYVGMGSVVVNDLSKKGMYYGSPARYMKIWDGKTF